ncbi:MAG: tetratricopeptide repeat protein [Desulfobulbaceae bacterium]|nr:tetratricopeptide repeat protein [Desulfobulbaceae bacterium]
MRLPSPLPFFFIFMFFASTIYAGASPETDFSLGRRLFADGQYKEALSHFIKAFRDDPANPEINFYLGRSAFETGDFETAVMAFDRVLIMDPEAVRIKLEIARSYMELGSFQAAGQLFKEVLETDPPANVRSNIEQFLAIIAASQKRHFFSGTLTLTYGYDDNVKVSPIDRLVETVIGDVLLEEDTGTPQSDYVLSNIVMLNHAYRFLDTPYSLVTSVTNYNSFYGKEHGYDVNYFRLSSGFSWKGLTTVWSNSLFLNHLDLGYDRYLGSNGFESRLSLALSRYLSVMFDAKIENRAFFQTQQKDALNIRVGLTPVLSLGPNRFTASFSQEYENADADYYKYDRVSAMIRYDRVLPRDFSIFFSYRFQETNYDGRESLFDRTRGDDTHELSAGISKVLWKSSNGRKKITAQVGHTYTDSDSSIPLYTYRKNVTSTALAYSF